MKKKIFFVPLFALIALLLAVTAYAQGGAGSEEDPLVSKSYVDSKLSFDAISLEEGQRLAGGAGCEIILRSGEATAVDNGANGVSDVTAGRDLMSGDRVETNHLLLTPRDDGRGIKAESFVWLMVRGDYEIE